MNILKVNFFVSEPVPVVADLIAVLCPKGPLKVLIETTQKRNEPFLPGLLFTCKCVY